MSQDLKILLVDDEPRNLLALESLLSAEGRELVTATSGVDALRRLLDDDFALILMDIRMPELDGFETAEFIRERDRSRDTPIIFLTAATGDLPMARGYSLGAVDYIIKPVDPDILRFKVKIFLDLYRKNAEVRAQANELAQARAFLDSVLKGVTEHAIAALDREGRVLVWNEGARRIYGHPEETMRGQPAEVLAAGRADAVDFTALLRQVDRDGRVEVESQHIGANGRTFPAMVTISQRTDEAGEAEGYVFVSHDLTSHKQAEEARVMLVAERAARAAAEESQRHLQQLIDVSPGAVLITDARGHLSMANAVARSLFGEFDAGADLLHGGLHQLVTTDGDLPAPSAHPLARALATGDRVQGEQFIVRTPGGQEVPVLVSAAVVTEAGGRVSAGMMVLQDVTVLKELDQQKDDFLAAVAHDLKHPLTIIAGNAQLLERRARRAAIPESDSFAELLQSTTRTTRRATSMVNELLDLTRTQMQRPLPLDRSRVDLAAIALDVVTELARTSERHDIRIKATETMGVWDRNRLYRVVSNLVENAVKYSPQGGTVEVCVAPQRDAKGDRAELHVKDNGIGIPHDELPLVFGKFYRASNVGTLIEGSGIGLAAARQVAEAHGGSITVASTPGRGTTVSMYLPMTEEQA